MGAGQQWLLLTSIVQPSFALKKDGPNAAAAAEKGPQGGRRLLRRKQAPSLLTPC